MEVWIILTIAAMKPWFLMIYYIITGTILTIHGAAVIYLIAYLIYGFVNPEDPSDKRRKRKKKSTDSFSSNWTLEQFRENIKELLTQWRDIENLYKQFLDSNVDKSFATVATAITFALKFKKIQEKISKFEEKPLNSYQKEELEDFWSEIDPLMTSLLDLDFFTLVASVDTPNKWVLIFSIIALVTSWFINYWFLVGNPDFVNWISSYWGGDGNSSKTLQMNWEAAKKVAKEKRAASVEAKELRAVFDAEAKKKWADLSSIREKANSMKARADEADAFALRFNLKEKAELATSLRTDADEILNWVEQVTEELKRKDGQFHERVSDAVWAAYKSEKVACRAELDILTEMSKQGLFKDGEFLERLRRVNTYSDQVMKLKLEKLIKEFEKKI